MENFVITISRCCGGNGSAVGKLLSERLGVALYDRNLLNLASEASGINQALFEQADEKVKNPLLFKISKSVYHGELIPPGRGDFTSDKNLFNYQAKVLRELASQESFVVVGRAGGFVLFCAGIAASWLLKRFFTLPMRELCLLVDAAALAVSAFCRGSCIPFSTCIRCLWRPASNGVPSTGWEAIRAPACF